jgi:uncharacterized protein YukE
MPERVLSTAEAKQAIQKLQQIINGPLVEQIRALDTQGRVLSDPNVWDGNLAQQFRSEWPNTHSTLLKTQEALDKLRQDVQKINQNIMTAGGNQ